MGTQKGDVQEVEESSFLDIFDIDHSKYNTEVEEVVKSGESDLTIIPDVEEVEKPEESEEKDLEDKPLKEKETTEDKPPVVEESSKDVTELETILGKLVEDEVLIYDEEKEYEASPEGIKQLISETIEKKSQEVLESFKKSLPDEASKMLDILEKGGTVEDYLNLSQEIEFSKIPLEDREGNPLTQNQLHLIEDWMKIQKYTDEEIEETLKDYQESGIIKKQAEIAKKKLSEWQTEKNESLIKQREADKQASLAKEAEEAERFKEEVLNLKEIAGFKIPKEKASKLYEFITKPGKNGKTKFQEVDNSEKRLLYAYLAMEGFDKDKLVKDVVTKQALKLKKGLSNFKDSQAAPKRGGTDVLRQETSDVVKGINWIV